jgi:hypothetical protein
MIISTCCISSIVILFSCLINYTSTSNLRYLADTPVITNTASTLIPILNINGTYTLSPTRNITSVPLFLVPKCRNDADCSMNGVCKAGICQCNPVYQTLIETTLLKDARKILPSSHINNTKSPSNFTVEFDVIQLTNDQVKFCNYEQKKQLTAFLMSFFVGFGAEHFYLQRNKVAAAKLVFYFFCCLLNVIYFVLAKCVKNGKKFTEFIGAFEALYLGCGFIFMLLWNIYDWILIGNGTLTDGYGFPLTSWK